ncbi:MAG: nitroreductase family protein [Hyphomicrobiales bacterium]
MPENSNELIRFLRGLRAVREYTSEPIADSVLDDILEVGRWSGSASNNQPAEVVVVRDRAVLAKIGEGGARPAAGAAVALVIVTPGDAARHDLEVFDEARLVERLLLAARAHGLGGNIATLKGDGPDIIKRELGIPPEKRIWSVVTLGHIDHEARRARPRHPGPARKPASQFVHRDRY